MTSCLSSLESFSLYFEGRCNYAHFINRLDLELERRFPSSCAHSAAVELTLLLGASTEDEARESVASACRVALDEQPRMDWADVTRKLDDEPLFDSIYYDGGGPFNEYYETAADNRVPYVDGRHAQVLGHDASRVDDVYEAYAQETKIECEFWGPTVTEYYLSSVRSVHFPFHVLNSNDHVSSR